MTDLQNELIGSLVGLVRATEGNTHLITPRIDQLVLKSLRLSKASDNETLLKDYITLVKEAKCSLVPNCATCASPCGRTSDYDMHQLSHNRDDISMMKLSILEKMQDMAISGGMTIPFYRGIFSIGSDWDKAELEDTLAELEKM